MGELIRSRSLMLAKIESTYGTDPTPVVGTDALLAENVVLSWPAELIDRTALAGTISPEAPFIGRKFASATFDVEIAGSGAAGTAPDWGPLLRACGFSETVVASTSVTYDPISTSFESVTIYIYRDGLLYEINGARGNCSFALPAGGRPMMSFTMQGIAVAPADVAFPSSPTLQGTVPPPVVSAAFTVGGNSRVLANLNFDLQNTVTLTEDMNNSTGYGKALITNRNTAGSFDPEVELVATEPFWLDWSASTQNAISVTVGSTAGNICDIDCPAVVYREVNEADRNGILTYAIPFTCARSAGDDELVLVMT